MEELRGCRSSDPPRPTPPRITDLFFVDGSTFFVYGDESLRTTDRGSTFTPISLEAPSIRSRLIGAFAQASLSHFLGYSWAVAIAQAQLSNVLGHSWANFR